MTDHNEAPLGTAFTVSIEAREGVTTGISAADRSRTIQVAIQPESTAARPRPARSRLPAARAAAAACSSASARPRRRSTSRGSPGSNPSGVVCEIMNEDGTMARVHDLVPYASGTG